MSGPLAHWQRLPVLLRALLAAFVVQGVGSVVTVLPLLGNLHFLPRVPWALPVTLCLLWLFWWYFAGSGPPVATRSARRAAARVDTDIPLPWRALVPVLLCALLAMVSLRLLLPSLLPVAAPSVSIDLGPYPLPTVIGLLLSIAAIAAVTEELAIRGYLQRPLEERYGIVPAIVVSGVAWWLMHADKVSWTHLPFHLTASVLLGLVAWLTGSLKPCVLAHFLGDAILQPAYLFRTPDFVWSALNARPLWEQQPASLALPAALAGVLLLATGACVPGFVRLARLAPRRMHADLQSLHRE